jgi:hypothetical protein
MGNGFIFAVDSSHLSVATWGMTQSVHERIRQLIRCEPLNGPTVTHNLSPLIANGFSRRPLANVLDGSR